MLSEQRNQNKGGVEKWVKCDARKENSGEQLPHWNDEEGERAESQPEMANVTALSM
jgi:hypothetical protein